MSHGFSNGSLNRLSFRSKYRRREWNFRSTALTLTALGALATGAVYSTSINSGIVPRPQPIKELDLDQCPVDPRQKQTDAHTLAQTMENPIPADPASDPLTTKKNTRPH